MQNDSWYVTSIRLETMTLLLTRVGRNVRTMNGHNLRQMLALALVSVWSLGCPASGPSGMEEPENEQENVCVEEAADECSYYNAECAPSRIAETEDERCATCTFDEEITTFCGSPEVARCIDQVNSFGHRCQTCMLSNSDEVLYDDCLVETIRQDSQCETIILEPQADAADGGEANAEEDAEAQPQQCEICSDSAGTVISFNCRPQHDACTEVEHDGRTCTECSFEGEFVFRECEQWPIDPSTCVRYQDQNGQCIDCFDAQGALLTHQCMQHVVDEANLFCNQFVTPDGKECQKCYDRQGNLLEETCEEAGTGTAYCERLEYEEQTCVMCVGEDNDIRLIDCALNTCVSSDDLSCEDPPACENTYSTDANICRTCPYFSPETNQRIDEEICLSGGELVCEESTELVERNISGESDDVDEQITVQVNCVICSDDGLEVYRNCDDGTASGIIAPPICETVSIEQTNLNCQICYDPETNEEVFNDCPVCEEQEDITNDTCTVCRDSDQTIVFSDCAVCEMNVHPLTDTVCTTCTSAGDSDTVVYTDCPNCQEQADVTGDTCILCTDAANDAETVFSSCLICSEVESVLGTTCTSCVAPNNPDEIAYTECPTCVEQQNEVDGSCVECFAADDDQQSIYTDCSTCSTIDLPNGTQCQECVDPNDQSVTKSNCPACQTVQLTDTISCETCVDQMSGDPVFTLCTEECEPVVDTVALTQDDGMDPIYLQDPTLEQDAALAQEMPAAVLSCTGCSPFSTPDSDFETLYSQCSLTVTCSEQSGDSSDASDSPTGDDATDNEPEEVSPYFCQEAVTMSRKILKCGNPWDSLNGDAPLPVQIMQWTITEVGVPVQDVTVEQVGPAEDCESCSCSTGYTVQIAVPGDFTETYAAFNFSVLND